MAAEWTKLRDHATTDAQHALLDALERGLSQREAAIEFDVSRGTVASRLRLLRRRFASAQTVVPVLPSGAVFDVSTLVGPGADVKLQWVKAKHTAQADRARWEAIKAAMATLAAFEPGPFECEADDDLCNVIVIGDAHVGMLAYARETGAADWDLQIAERVMSEAFSKLHARLPRAGNLLIVNVGDFLHHENNNRETPRSKHKVDGDSRFIKVAECGIRILRHAVETGTRHSRRVTLANVPGNHDPDGSRWMNMLCRQLYRVEDGINVLDNAQAQLYWRFGQTLIGMMHGDGVPFKKMAQVLAEDRREDWGKTTRHRVVSGHHHTYEAEMQGTCLVEKYPTLAPLDYYAAHAGYRSERSLNAFTLHRHWGEIGRAKVYAEEIEQLSKAA